MAQISEFLRLLLGTVIYRPYVYAFFACFLVFAIHHLGPRRTLYFIIQTYLVTYLCEYSSTRNGFPFGPYTYFDETRTRELWLANVPFWDSLSFVFLSYFSYVMAAALLTPREVRKGTGNWPAFFSPFTPILGGIIMMLLDVVIDPLTLQGEKWFLGKIYNYPYEGFYFGVTAANFGGWFFVGWATQRLFQIGLKYVPWFSEPPWRKLHPLFVQGILGVYAGVFAFNFAITLWIQYFKLAFASAVVASSTLGFLYFLLFRRNLASDK